MRKIKYTLLVILTSILLGGLIVLLSRPTQAAVTLVPLKRDGTQIYYRNTSTPVMTPNTYVEKEAEFRGVWVPTVWNLAMPKHTSEAQYKQYFKDMIARVKSKNINAILFQTRPNNDAFYDSEHAPYSKWFTGTEGVSPGWDAMGWMVNYAHEQGIKFHAWLNPYRVYNSAMTKSAYLATLHDDNFAKKNPDYVIAGVPNDSNVYPYILDPGRPQVKEYIKNVVSELITKYDVDGIHFDDYFYPYSGTPESEDQITYNLYNPDGLSRADWRRKNVDDAVSGVKQIIDNHNEAKGKNVKFGISPFGIWRNKSSDPLGSNTAGLQSYSAQYADSRKWVKNNWVHYITPQVYWQFTHSTAPYADVVDWWAETVRGTDVDLIVGHSITSTSLPDDEMIAQTKYNQKHPEIKGSILYSAGLNTGDTNYLTRPVINNLVSQHWKTNVPNVYSSIAPESFKTKLNNYYSTTLNTPNYTTTENINLITSLDGHTITWLSNKPSFISHSGVVTRPTVTEGDALVTLTAKNQYNEIVTYQVTVPAEEGPILPPTHSIEGELNEEGAYTTPITITLTAEPGLRIEYFYVTGSGQSPQVVYSEPFMFDERFGGYMFTAYTYDSEDRRSEPYRFSVKMNIPYDETYTKVIRNGAPVKYKETGQDIILPTYTERAREIRAVWVATVHNIDVPRYQNEEQYKAYLIDILDTVKSLNMNTVFFQVRSMNDAFYPSNYAPYSEYIKGTMGEGLDWDILEFMVTEAHNRGLELHAWLNPYRVMNAATGTFEEKIARLHPDNFARKYPQYVMEDNQGALILNPGEPRVRQYLYNVIGELMNNYEIDGIHMDDYFYTYGGHKPEHDATTYANNNPEGLPLADWRRSNVDKMVEQTFNQVEAFNTAKNRNIKWGISPIGIWRSITDDPLGSHTAQYAASSYRDQYADTRKWVKEGWLHYINPQVYWEISRSVAPYADIVKWWNDVAEGTGVKVVVGQGFYRMIENNTSMNHEDEMVDQIRLNRRFRNVIGTSFFSYRTLKSNHRVVQSTLMRFKNSFWTKEVPWAWPTDVKEPDSDEVIAKKVLLNDLIDEISGYVETVVESSETDRYRLNLSVHYSSAEQLELINGAILTANTIAKERGHTVADIEAAVETLLAAYQVFNENVIIGLGEIVTPEKQQRIDDFSEALEGLIAYKETILPTALEKEDLTAELYAPETIYNTTVEFINRALALLEQKVITDEELTNYETEIVSVRVNLEQSVFRGTNENAINRLKQDLLDEIARLEELIDSYKVTDETDANKLKKGETYLPLNQISALKQQLSFLRNQVESATSLEALEAINTNTLKPFETTLGETTIVGTKAPGLSVEMIIYIALGGFMVLMFIGLAVLVVKRRKA